MAYAYGMLFSRGTIIIKHAFLLRTPKIRERSPRWLTWVKTKVIRYMLGPTYTYAFLLSSWLKKGSKKRRRKKRKTVNLHTSHHSHHGVGGYSKLINGLRAAASAWRLCTPTSALTVHMLKMYCKEGMSVVLSFTTLFITRKREK